MKTVIAILAWLLVFFVTGCASKPSWPARDTMNSYSQYGMYGERKP